MLIQYLLGLLFSVSWIVKQTLNSDVSRSPSVLINMSWDDMCTSTFTTGLELKYIISVNWATAMWWKVHLMDLVFGPTILHYRRTIVENSDLTTISESLFSSLFPSMSCPKNLRSGCICCAMILWKVTETLIEAVHSEFKWKINIWLLRELAALSKISQICFTVRHPGNSQWKC